MNNEHGAVIEEERPQQLVSYEFSDPGDNSRSKQDLESDHTNNLNYSKTNYSTATRNY